ncbi:hypothetical protein [Streptomyces violascens]|uniref:hypothetical protein n=1 Tax=Streptomyces violascens TaxID=67381 RepID=UPI001678DC81|nr:hypothetical protein [Streptomyces violascens]
MNNSTARRLPLAALACTAVLLTLTACNNDSAGTSKSTEQAPMAPPAKANGIEELPAADIYNKAMRTNAEAGSFRERMDRSDAVTDLRLSATECTGTVDKKQRGSFEIVVKGSDIFAKLDQTLAKELDNQVPDAQWIHGTRDNALMKALASYCHQEQFTHPYTASTTMTKKAIRETGGHRAVPVELVSGGKPMTYLVSADGTSNLLSVDSSDNTEAGDITYSDFGKPVGATTPTNVVEAPSH